MDRGVELLRCLDLLRGRGLRDAAALDTYVGTAFSSSFFLFLFKCLSISVAIEKKKPASVGTNLVNREPAGKQSSRSKFSKNYFQCGEAHAGMVVIEGFRVHRGI